MIAVNKIQFNRLPLGLAVLAFLVLAETRIPAAGAEVEAVLKEAQNYRHGQSRKALNLLEQIVSSANAAAGASAAGTASCQARSDLAARLAAALPGAAVPEAGEFLMKQLAVIGGEKEVPALAALLSDERLSFMARYALERIPAPAASQALREALSRSAEKGGKLAAGLANSLGNRRDPESVPALAALLAAADRELACAAAAALGKIGGEEAARALRRALPAAAGELRSATSEASLSCAEHLLAEGKRELAAALYRELVAPGEPAPARHAALRGLAASSPEEGAARIGEALSSSDEQPRRAAVQCLRDFPEAAGRLLASLRSAIKSHDPEARRRSIRALGFWPETAPLGDLLEAAKSESDESLRALALEGVARLCGSAGGATCEPPERFAASLAAALELPASPGEKKALLAALARQPCLAALRLARARLEAPELREAACAAMVKIAGALDRSQRDEAIAAVQQVLAASQDAEVIQRADLVLRRAARPVNLALGAAASSPDGLESDGSASGDQAAIDGNPDTLWDEVDNQPLYRLRVDFKQPTEVSSINIKGHAYRSHSPRDFDILLDGKLAKAVRGADYDRETNEFSAAFPAARCQALELAITGYYGGSPAIRELEIYNLPAPKPAAAGTAAVAAAPGLAWQRTDSSIALTSGGPVIWQLNWPKEAAKPYFHPVALAGGEELTWLSPPDHPWHRSLWFAWKELNGLNYWEEDARTGQAQGRTEVTEVKVDPRADHSAAIDMALSYHPPGQPAVLAEKRSIFVSAPDAEGAYRIDWKSLFTATGGDVLMKGGTAGGGYAGLSARIAPKTRDWRLLDSEGREDVPGEGVAKNTHGQRARWLDFSLVDAATGRACGISILDHPANLRHPSQWHNVIEGKIPFGYFSPAPLWSEPYTLAAGKELALEYRIAIHPGRWTRERLEREWKALRAARRP